MRGALLGHLGAPSFAFSPRHLGVQGVQPLLPQGPVPAQPLIDLGQRLGTKAIDTPLRLLANLHEPRLTQHPQVPRDAGSRDRQQRRQVTRSGRTAGERLEHRPPAVVRQRPQNSFHGSNVPNQLRNCQGTYSQSNGGLASTTEVSIWRSGMSQYLLSSSSLRCGVTSSKPCRR